MGWGVSTSVRTEDVCWITSGKDISGVDLIVLLKFTLKRLC